MAIFLFIYFGLTCERGGVVTCDCESRRERVQRLEERMCEKEGNKKNKQKTHVTDEVNI